MSFKIAFIGAGSVSFTRKLVCDLLILPQFADIEIALHDIDAQNLDLIHKIVARIITANNLPTKVTASVDRKTALDGARYVVNCVRVGGLEAFDTDITIPLRYGVDQCVGDTLCAGGIMYGQRTIPQLLAFADDMNAVCETNALMLNYANPMAMNCWALADHGIAHVGLCHGVQNGWRQIADALRAEDPAEVDYICIGINHQTWYTDIRYQGRQIGPEELAAAFEAHPNYSVEEKLRIDVLKRFGAYSTESNGHLSEYLPWYRKRPKEITRWIDLSNWINGETGGYLRVCKERRNWFEEDFPTFLAEADAPLSNYIRTDEHCSYIIDALEGGPAYRGHFNLRNDGLITNLAADAIVEAPGYVDRFGFNMAAGHTLPHACAATCTASIDVQRMAVAAATIGDITLLKQAMLHDPLVGAVCNPEEVWAMADDMLVAQARWLPQYRDQIEPAKARRAASPVKPRDWNGAARLPTRTVEDLRKSHANLAVESVSDLTNI